MNKNELEMKDVYITPEMLKFIVDNISNGTISSGFQKYRRDIKILLYIYRHCHNI